MRHPVVKASLIFLISLVLVNSATANADRNQQLDTYLQEQLQIQKVAGATLAVIEGNHITHTSAFGVKSTADGSETTVDTVFQAASISKAVTAWGVMRLFEEGKIDLDAPVSTYLTRWHLPPSSFEENAVTLRRVLSHTAGLSLPSYVGFEPTATLPGFEGSLSGDTNGSGSLNLVTKPGEHFAYSGGGYTLLGLIIEEVSGLSFADYMQTQVLDPLGMTNSSYMPGQELISRTAQAHDFHLNPIPNYRLAAQGAGSLHTTVSDLARFAIANMSDNPVLTRETIREMHTPIIGTGFGNQMGLGFFVEADGQLIGHSGSNRGWKARLQFWPASQAGLVILTNAESGEALVNNGFCYWNDRFQIGLLTASCANRAEQLSLLNTAGWLITTLIASISLALAMRLLANVLINKRTFRRPMLTEWRYWAIAIITIIAIAHVAFFYSCLGVWLVAGIPWGFSITDHAPAPIQYAIHTLLLLIAVIAASLFLRRQADQ